MSENKNIRPDKPEQPGTFDDPMRSGLGKSEFAYTDRDVALNDPYDLMAWSDFMGSAINEDFWSSENRSPDKPLVILLGEMHNCPSHILSHICAVSHILRLSHETGEKVVFAEERDCNLLNKYLYDHGLVSDEFDGQWWNKHDPEGRATLTASIARNTGCNTQTRQFNAPLSKAYLHHFLLENQVPYTPNDVLSLNCKTVEKEDPNEDPDISNYIIDPADPQLPPARDLLERLENVRIDPDAVFSPDDQDGIALRNAVMVRNALEFARQNNASIIVQRTGMAHVFGFRPDNPNSYTTSLAGLFSHFSAQLTPILIDWNFPPEMVEKILETPLIKHPNTLLCRGLEDMLCFRDNPQIERAVITELKSSFRDQACPVSFQEPEISRKQARAELNKVHAQAFPGLGGMIRRTFSF